MKKALDFQSIIIKLQDFWAERNCLIWQPYYSQVGAGTMNPATFLRVLGPEPWHVAYVEPSIRPDDGRYGDNPNRLQQFYQFQVILKPDPGNPQEVYLESLKALGIDPGQHDIRFVEDNWQQPAIGAWGLGWEVWLDGQEITQFTYFQQCGGQELNPVSVELTYGLERIAMTLQGVRHFKDIQWSPERTYGDVNLMGEREHSTYYFDVANIDRMWKLYEMYENEAENALEAGLVLPAHDYVLKTSHTFNILDTRGAVGVTERQALFKRTRELARRVAAAYVEQRQSQEFPWLKTESTTEDLSQPQTVINNLETAAPFVLEVGTEELPTSDLESAIAQLKDIIPATLDELRLAYGAVRVEGTPRRLVVTIEDLSAWQADLQQEIKGPPADRAYDADGKPTRVAEGFARSKGVQVSELLTKTLDGGDYVVAQVEEKGSPTWRVLSEALPGVIAGIRFNKSMRWNESGIAFSRPIRWLLALHGDQIVPFSYAGYNSGRETHGLRFGSKEIMKVDSPLDYLEKMKQQGIILDPTARRMAIKKQADALAEGLGGRIPKDDDLLVEIANLVEKPTAFVGHFDAHYLELLPPEVLVSVMKKHQRYFVIENEEGDLLPHFIGVRNGGEDHLDIVSDGNEQVILARFDDAAFFVKKDLQKPIKDFVDELDTLVFQEKLGSFLEKSRRIEKLVKSLANWFSLTQEEVVLTQRAARLCKADLATNMVVEMTSLQGVMGKYYAIKSGEDPIVAEAIFEHYLPRSANDKFPSTKPGLLVSLADRLDSIVGLFAAGLAPTGTKDPFALRRAALGICQNLIKWQQKFDIEWALKIAADGLDIEVAQETLQECKDFILGRLRVMLLDLGFNYDVVDAVLAEQGHDPFGAFIGVKTLSSWVGCKEWSEILPAYSRCVRITRDKESKCTVDEALFETDSEKALYQGVLQAEVKMSGERTVDAFMDAFTPLIPEINRFFEEVMVMVEDDAVRENRLGLLQGVTSLTDGIVDMSCLEGF